MEKLILRRLDRTGEEMILNFGPQHPSTHGVINFLVDTDGEVMRKAIPDIGYLHRSIEKIAESTGYPGFMPYTDRIDYVAAMFANEGYAIAVEKLLKLEIPPRAQWLRAISGELCRIASHLVSVGTMASDIGASTPLVHALREREMINDLIEALCGARLTYNYCRIGGVAFDMPTGWAPKVIKFLDHFESLLVEFDRLISKNSIYVKRLTNVCVITREQAIDYGLVGPNLRGSGVDWDVRRDAPYGAYPHFKFEVPVGRGLSSTITPLKGTTGDAFDRYYVRILEMAQSSRIVRQALETMPEGEITAKVPRKIKPEAGEAFSRVESARGEMAYYVVSDGTENAYRVHARTGSFMAMGIIEDISRGLMVADLVALIASLDVVAPEIDR
ncbi:MAG: NADH-quinone oxidoreductase subunit D [Candidatus Doudnabacteria bacterium]